jgi:thiol-disulfide isomerase/thioredoxin
VVSSAPQARVRAPELVGRGGWINTGGTPLSLAELRGKIVILDFWTFCCVNCLHVLDELRELEARFADVLVIIGVHSPKFVHEADHDALIAAVERYDVAHPVLDDPDLATWSSYAVRAWPTLSLIDPEGYVVAQLSGEGHAHALERMIDKLITDHDAKGTLRRGDSPYVPPIYEPTDLRHPGKALRIPDGTMLVADTSRHALVLLDLASDGPAGGLVIGRIGSGTRGLLDGPATEAQFNEPNGILLLPPEIASSFGYDLVVADTVNHALRGVRFEDGAVTTIAGTGKQWMQADPTNGPALATPLSSPWDVAWFNDRVYIAMAGEHRLWSFDPRTSMVRVEAGTTQEGLVDGPAAQAWFAQPSALAVDDSAEVPTLWVIDAETSALRRLTNGVVTTHIGRGLFDFGHVDGPASDALLQHPLGLAVLPDGSIAVADSYNGAIRRYDPATDTVTTLATDLSEPADVVVLPDEELPDGTRGAMLLVVESNAHRVTRVPIPAEVRTMSNGAFRTQRPTMSVAPGPVRLRVLFDPPPGEKLDDRYGPSTYVTVSATPPELLTAGTGSDTALERDLVLNAAIASGVLHVSARAASCDDGDAEFPACHLHQQDWGIPIDLSPDGSREVLLVLAGPVV